MLEALDTDSLQKTFIPQVTVEHCMWHRCAIGRGRTKVTKRDDHDLCSHGAHSQVVLRPYK